MVVLPKGLRHQTALMQWLQRLVMSGHVFWVSDVIAAEHVPRLGQKWSSLAWGLDAPARAYRRKKRQASVHWVISPIPEADTKIRWWFLSTPGRGGLAPQGEPRPLPGEVRDARLVSGRVRLGHYELVQWQREVMAGKRPKAVQTWTWRLSSQRYREWEALLVQLAREGNVARLRSSWDALSSMPMFAGVRSQVTRLMQETNRMLRKCKREALPLPALPTMRWVGLWVE